MSIIQDALRRKEGGAPAPSGRANIFPPPPPPGGPPAEKRNTPLLILLAVVLAGLLGWILYATGVFGRSKGAAPAGPAAPAAQAHPAPRGPPPMPAAEKPKGAAPDSLAGSASSVVARAAAAVATAASNLENRIALEMGTNSAAAAGGGADGTNAVPAAEGSPAAPAGTDEPRWPPFMVRGVILVPGQPGLAMIDDQALDQGRTTQSGIRIVEVQAERVVLEFKGETRTYSVGSGEP